MKQNFLHIVYIITIGLNVGGTRASAIPLKPQNRRESIYFDQDTNVDESAWDPGETGYEVAYDAKSSEAFKSSQRESSDETSRQAETDYESNMAENIVAEKTMAGGGLRLDIDNAEVNRSHNGPHLENEKVTVKFMQDLLHPQRSAMPHEKYAYIILREIKKHYQNQPSLIDIKVPNGQNITVVGDVHGQYPDLIQVFNISGLPSKTNMYLFNGDFVDKGRSSTLIALVLFGFKLLYPKSFFINRGNHEDRNQNMGGGFYQECESIYSSQMTLAFQVHGEDREENVKIVMKRTSVPNYREWQESISKIKQGFPDKDVFTWLPLAHRINGKVLVVHGGLSPKKGVTLKDIKQIPRGMDPQSFHERDVYFSDYRRECRKMNMTPTTIAPWINEQLMFSLLWSDPMDRSGLAVNDRRGGGVRFGPDISEDFCRRNKIDFIIRSHEPKKWGFEVEHNGRVVTLFSAADYFTVDLDSRRSDSNRGALIQMRSPEMKTHFVVWSEEDREKAWKSYQATGFVLKR